MLLSRIVTNSPWYFVIGIWPRADRHWWKSARRHQPNAIRRHAIPSSVRST